MSLYDVMFGQNPIAPLLLAMLDLQTQDFNRFRDAFVSNGEIAVYTRCGGPNREEYFPYELTQHDNYLRDQDDTFDSTYATIYFSIPPTIDPAAIEALKRLDIGPFDPDKRWQDALAEMRRPDFVPTPAMVELNEKLNQMLDSGGDGIKIVEV